MKTLKIITLFFFYVLSLNAIAQDTLLVPVEYETIQTAINAAVDNDIVLVSEGTYLENINFLGKAITVTSEYFIDKDTSHISSTIINGSEPDNLNTASVITMISGEDTTSVLMGFTITGGEGTYFSAYGAYTGGGIFIIGGAKITNNHIINNSIIHNNSWFYGGGIFINTGENGNVIIKNNLIANNSIIGPEFIWGGGICCYGNGSIIITKNRIKNNIVEAENPIDRKSGGGGIYIFGRSPVIVNNVIIENVAPYGGGIASRGNADGYNIRLINNTIADNNASIKGGGVYLYNGQCSAINNIFWNNTAPNDPDIFYRGTMNITYSITQGVFPGIGNMQTDPLFENSDYYLSDQSPAIDAGNPNIEFYDIANPDNITEPLWPAKGSLTADMGAFGGNDTVNIEIENYLVQDNFLYEQFNNMYYRFAYPLNYNDATEYPLTIVLHGSGQVGSDNEKQLYEGLAWRVNAEYYDYNEFTIVPQAPNFFGWGEDNIYNLIRNTIENFPIDTTKIVVTGWSMGGGGTWELLNLYPQLFSAAIPVCGTYKGFDEIKYVPVWVHHGSADVNVPVSVSQYYISSFENTGLTAVYTEDSSDNQINDAINNNARLFYSEYEGATHFILKHAYDNHFMFDWLKKQSRPLIRPINSDVSYFNEDSLLFITYYDNPNNFEFEHALIVEDLFQNRLDSLDLFDDGEHGDGMPEDGIWGNYIEIIPEVTEYRIGIIVKNLFNDKEFYFHDLDTISITTTGINDERLNSNESVIQLQNYPNPFNSVTTISYHLTKTCNVELSVYNILGQKIAELVSEKQVAGKHTIDWDALNLPNGIYISTLNIDGNRQYRKMFKVR